MARIVLFKLLMLKPIILFHDVPLTEEEDESHMTPGSRSLVWIQGQKCPIIVHNKHMKSWFTQKGFEAERIVELGLFDYLDDISTRDCEKEIPQNLVYIAGNLSLEKAGFVRELGDIKDVKWVV